MSNKSPIVLFLMLVLFTGAVSPAFSQSSTSVSNLYVKLELAPSHVEKKNSLHSIGYVNLVDKNGLAVKAPYDITVELKSDDHSIASIPSEITIPSGSNYGHFDVSAGNNDGEVKISVIFDGKIDHKTLQVGGIENSLPDDIKLVINLPTDKMHVNSEMPFSVFLQDAEGNVIRAPYDIEILLDSEESLLEPSLHSLTIEKGDYYAWGILKTNKNVGNSFLSASFEKEGLDSAVNIEITSSLPTGLRVSVFPEKISSEVERIIDIFISLVDSDGLPAVTPKDVSLELFSDNELVSKALDESMKDKKAIIKQGEFGYYLREDLILTKAPKSVITIGASAKDLGIATDTFETVKNLNIENPKAENTTLNLFALDKIPSDTTSVLVYQIVAIASGPSNEVESCESEIDCIVQQQNKENLAHPIDALEEGEFYPVQSNENYRADGSVNKLNIISSDSSIINIEHFGSIDSTKSYGTALIKSGQKNGEVTLAATIKGIGAGTIKTEVIDVFKHVKTKIFSPTGSDSIVLDKNGYFDLFLVALDGKNRPKILEKPAKYLLSPVNEVLEIDKGSAFSYANFHSDSFNAGSNDSILVKAVPIGVESELGLESNTNFKTQVSSIVDVKIPFENLDAKSDKPYNGIVQLTDLLGNPSVATKDIKIKLASKGANIMTIPEYVTISQGSSYATFPITANGQKGDAVISASVKGVTGSDAKISTVSNEPKLKIFTSPMDNPIEPGIPVEIEVFVDDENAQSVPGASVKFETTGATITPKDPKTGTSGSILAELVAEKGPIVSVQIFASAEGYVDAKQTFDYQVKDSPNSTIDLGLPDWALYVGLAAIAGIISVVMVFLKKPKEILEEEDEYEEEI